MELGNPNTDTPRLGDGSIDYTQAARLIYIIGITNGAKFIEAMVDEVRAGERRRCAEVAEALDSGHGNENEIAKEIRNLGDET